MKILGCIQPSYIPWRGYFHIIQRSDIFVFHEDVQYTKQDWRNRNQVKTTSGKQWLTVPVQKNTSKGTINEVLIDNTRPWYKKHWRILEQAYQHAPYFEMYRDFFADVYSHPWKLLSVFDIYLIEHICKFLNITTTFIRSPELSLTGAKTDRLVQMCQQVEATHYLSGPSAQDYIVPEEFEAVGVVLEYQTYEYPEYPQLHGDFDPYVSILDLLFNCGPDSPQYIFAQ